MFNKAQQRAQAATKQRNSELPKHQFHGLRTNLDIKRQFELELKRRSA